MKHAILFVAVLLAANCNVGAMTLAEPPADPFEVTFVKGAKWTQGRDGYDPALPGCHLTGQIATITLKPKADKLPDKLVLAIRTSPGMPPMIEGFTLKTADATVETSLKQGGNEFVRLAVVGDAVHVTFTPAGMQLLKKGATISWVDWYR